MTAPTMIVVVETRRSGQTRIGHISVAVKAVDVRRGSSATALAAAEELFDTVEQLAARSDAEAPVEDEVVQL